MTPVARRPSSAHRCLNGTAAQRFDEVLGIGLQRSTERRLSKAPSEQGGNNKQLVFRTMSDEEQVWIPLEGARYRVDTSWDRNVVLLSGPANRLPQGAQVTNGQVVSSLSSSELRPGIARVVIELNHPATPEIKVVGQGQTSFLRLAYLR